MNIFWILNDSPPPPVFDVRTQKSVESLSDLSILE